MNNKYLIESRDIKFPKRRYEETDFLFGNDVGVSPKAPFTIQGGVFIPLNREIAAFLPRLPRRTAGYGSIQLKPAAPNGV